MQLAGGRVVFSRSPDKAVDMQVTQI